MLRSCVKRLEGLQKVPCMANTTAVYIRLPASDGFLSRHVSTHRRSRGIGS